LLAFQLVFIRKLLDQLLQVSIIVVEVMDKTHGLAFLSGKPFAHGEGLGRVAVGQVLQILTVGMWNWKSQGNLRQLALELRI